MNDIYEQNKEIFNFIKPKDNDKISKFDSKDKNELIKRLSNYFLEYRKTIYVGENITFGVEIEFDNSNNQKIVDEVYSLFYLKKWIMKPDTSLYNGGEIVSPVMIDSPSNWFEISKMCSLIRTHAEILPSTGGHIHIGSNIFDNNYKYILNFIKLWSVYENIIFRFTSGNFTFMRPNVIKYACPVKEDLDIIYEYIRKTNSYYFADVISELCFSRNLVVNFYNMNEFYRSEDGKHTIEFRCPNGTLDPVIWQNNINFFIRLLKYSKSRKFNIDKIENRKKLTSNIDYNTYYRIYLEQALELADMIFNNNLDKLYFLRQYLKSDNSVSKKYKRLDKSITVTYMKGLK